MANPEHLEALKGGTPSWNRWRHANRDWVPDLSGAHLRDVRLSGADLTGARCVSTYFGQGGDRPALPSVTIQPIVHTSDEAYATFEHLARYPWVAELVRYASDDELAAWLPGFARQLDSPLP